MTWAETGEIIEQKKWLINRFEAAMDVNKEELITMRETFNSYINRIDIGLKEGRTITLTAVALIASVVLGIAYEQIKISYSYIIGIILSIIIVEMVVFVVLSIFRQRAYSIIRQVDLAFFFAIDKMNIVEGVHMINTVNLQKIEIDRLEFFVDYSRFAAMVVRLPLLDAYTSVYNSLLFRSLRPQVNVGIEFHHIL